MVCFPTNSTSKHIDLHMASPSICKQSSSTRVLLLRYFQQVELAVASKDFVSLPRTRGFLRRTSFKNRRTFSLCCLNGLFPTDMELAQFTSDVETLLGGGTEREFHTMEELGLDETLKTEQEEEEEMATREVCDLDDADETAPFEISFDYEYSHKTTFDEEEDEKEDVMDVGVNEMSGRIKEEKKEKALMLRLDYEAVISTWGGQGTPWAAREPPKIDIDMVCFPTNST
ncbi:hypothetical protein AALP_AAs51417U000100, partial [Arabis alpina]